MPPFKNAANFSAITGWKKNIPGPASLFLQEMKLLGCFHALRNYAVLQA
jgi:hypothetical protein